MKSFTQVLNGWSNDGKGLLLSHIKTAEDVENVFTKIKGMAKDGVIEVEGMRLDVNRAINMVREYIGRELHQRYDVMKANGLYVAQ